MDSTVVKNAIFKCWCFRLFKSTHIEQNFITKCLLGVLGAVTHSKAIWGHNTIASAAAACSDEKRGKCAILKE